MLRPNDIVYILKDTPENEELVYSLRSLENFPHRKVVFVGGCPKNLKPDIWIPVEQDKDTKWSNSANNLKIMCQDSRLTPDVYLFNDDFFVLSPIKFLPTYKNHDLLALARLVTKNWSIKSEYIDDRIMPTIKELRRLGLSINNYELHVPMLINREKMLVIYDVMSCPVAKRSFYGNYYNIGGVDIDQEGMQDGSVQNKNGKVNFSRTFVSSTDESWQRNVGAQIRNLFPRPSRYELPSEA